MEKETICKRAESLEVGARPSEPRREETERTCQGSNAEAREMRESSKDGKNESTERERERERETESKRKKKTTE